VQKTKQKTHPQNPPHNPKSLMPGAVRWSCPCQGLPVRLGCSVLPSVALTVLCRWRPRASVPRGVQMFDLTAFLHRVLCAALSPSLQTQRLLEEPKHCTSSSLTSETRTRCNNIWGVQDVLFPEFYLEGRWLCTVIAWLPAPSVPVLLSASLVLAPAAGAEVCGTAARSPAAWWYLEAA